MLIAEYVILLIIVILLAVFSWYFARYLTWKYPEYHSDDLVKATTSSVLLGCALVVLVVLMAAD